jgi:hypothetical protein
MVRVGVVQIAPGPIRAAQSSTVSNTERISSMGFTFDGKR